MADRSAALFLFVHLGTWDGMHAGAWRSPDVPGTAATDFERIKHLVQTAERGKFHGVFLADTLALLHNMSHEAIAGTTEAEWLEPFTLCSALAACTNRIGLALTANTTYNEPYHVARKFASLDHISGGRVAWNIVAGGNRIEAMNFSRSEHMQHSLRYERAQEFFDVVTGLWDSWEDDAFVRDKGSGVYFDLDKLHPLNHKGEFFSVEGPLTLPRPVQGHPVIAQAGSSPEGLRFAAPIADTIFTLQHEIESARAFYADVKAQVAAAGRDPDHALILPGLTVLVGRTQAEAEERLALLDGLVPPDVALGRLAFVIDHDLSGHPLDGPVPEIPVTEFGGKTLQRSFLDRARRDNLTVRQLAELACGVGTLAGTPAVIADHIEEWVTTRAADGFNLSLAEASSLETFVDHVVPELQRRGIFHADYEGMTLREHLGLPRPASRHVRGAGVA